MQHFSRRKFDLYEFDSLNSWLKQLGFDLNRPAPLAEQVLKLSDVYNTQNGSPDVWDNKGFIAAYLVYFQPLNYLRMRQVIEDGATVGFWKGIENVVDFGAGLGTFELALKESDGRPLQVKKVFSFEPSTSAKEWARKIASEKRAPWIREEFKNLASLPKGTLVGFSYSLTEMDKLPDIAESAEALLFLEPSTLESGRSLQELRGQLIEKGFHAWAPCLHQNSCPLLKHSPRDWCHTRIHVEMPEWFQNLERHLPMKNSTLTYSYLLARKTVPPAYEPNDFRIIGDTLFEKGKVRQAICQSDKRQFFAWLKKSMEAPSLPRGALIKVNSPLLEKSDEVRPEGDTFEYLIKKNWPL